MASKGLYPFDVLIPKTGLREWSVIACDQHSSDKSYWEKVRENIGDLPSTLNFVLPEIYLNETDLASFSNIISQNTEQYIKDDIFKKYENSMVYVERQQSNGKLRKGIVGLIDLEDYDFENVGRGLIRPTEEVVMSRIPPRVEVKRNSKLDITHVLLFVLDKENKLFGNLKYDIDNKIYDLDLMENGGNIKGYLINGTNIENIQNTLSSLIFDDLLFLVGDGNHSLVTAKKIYEEDKTKEEKRYAMVEVINLYDESLLTLPIHRIVYNDHPKEILDSLFKYYPGSYEGFGDGHYIKMYSGLGEINITIPFKYNGLAVGAMQEFLDYYVSKNNCKIDYIHDEEEVKRVGFDSGNAGFVLPQENIDSLIEYVKTKGKLPRKSFSIGHQQDKKYYLECRKY